MKKFIIAILLMFTVTGAYSQNALVQKRNTESAPFYSIKFTQTDSLVNTTLYSDWFDASSIQGQTLYLTDSLVANGARDTINVYIEGRVWANTQYIQLNLDTVLTLVGGVTGASSSAGVTQTLLSLSGSLPEWRFKVQNKSVGGNPRKFTAWLALTANTTNYLRPSKKYGNLP